MKYRNPDETRRSAPAIREKFQTGRPLPLKGRSVPIFERAVPDPDARVLEIGPGAGKFLAALAQDGYRHLSACDIDRYLLPEVEASLERFAVLDLSFDPLPWPGESFDAVAAWEVLEHLENPHHAVREILRVLKPGGRFLLSLPNIFHIVSRLVFLKRGVFPQWNETNNHISLFPRGVFEKAILRYFTLVETGYVGSGVNLPFLRRIRALPENEWFGRWAYSVLEKSDEGIATRV